MNRHRNMASCIGLRKFCRFVFVPFRKWQSICSLLYFVVSTSQYAMSSSCLFICLCECYQIMQHNLFSESIEVSNCWTIWIVWCPMSQPFCFDHDRHCLLTANGWRDFYPIQWNGLFCSLKLHCTMCTDQKPRLIVRCVCVCFIVLSLVIIIRFSCCNSIGNMHRNDLLVICVRYIFVYL